ncbi:MAG: archaemetzincin family Zn-dependent metalloprotease [Candidatus Bathyarchaeia archaeon]
MMLIGILRIGKVDLEVLERIKENLNDVFPDTECRIIPEETPLPQEFFDAKRMQHRSDMILSLVHEFAEKMENVHRVLGVVDVDIFVPGMNFVFGQAECPGKAAVISLWRLRPEFYGVQENMDTLVERGTKEAVHELGHTIGLEHCDNPFCVMYFSNSIFETDRKKSLFCWKCYVKIQKFLFALMGEGLGKRNLQS